MEHGTSEDEETAVDLDASTMVGDVVVEYGTPGDVERRT